MDLGTTFLLLSTLGGSLSTCTTGEKSPSPGTPVVPAAPSFCSPRQGCCLAPCREEPGPTPELPDARRMAPPVVCTCSYCWGPQDSGGCPGLDIFPPAGVGSAPEVRITGPEEDGVRVLCTVSGWFPKPQVQWRDGSGEKFLAFSEAHNQDAEGLFSVEAALVVRDRSVGNVTCSVLNPVLGQEKAMAIFIPGQCCCPLPVGLPECTGLGSPGPWP